MTKHPSGTTRPTAPDEAVLNVSNLRMRYGEREALTGLSFEVSRGELFALLGPNGAGKTSTVEILEGYRRRTGGEVRVLGTDPWQAGPGWRARIGVMLQESGPEPDLTVAECLRLYGGYFPDPWPAGDLLELTGLSPQSGQRAAQLSGGQQRKLDLALALTGRPQVLFLDEPTTGFDPAARRDAWDTIAALKDSGTSIILTTHYMEEAERLADRVAVIAAGALVAQGSPGRLIARQDHPSITFTLPAGLTTADLPEPVRVAASSTPDGTVTLSVPAPLPLLRLLADWAERADHAAALVVTVLVGAASFGALGFALTTIIRGADSAQPIIAAITLPLYFISGIFLAATLLPQWLLNVASVFPVRPFEQALLAAYNPYSPGSGFAGLDLLIVAAWGAAGLLIATRRFRWTPQSR